MFMKSLDWLLTTIYQTVFLLAPIFLSFLESAEKGFFLFLFCGANIQKVLFQNNCIENSGSLLTYRTSSEIEQ